MTESGEFARAFLEAQKNIEGATKAKENPHFRSKYADLGAVFDACKGALNDAGIYISQAPTTEVDEHGMMWVRVTTELKHQSMGPHFLSNTVSIPVSKQDAHGIGSAITYGRRYGLQSLVGICPVDDDGNKAVEKGVDSALKPERNKDNPLEYGSRLTETIDCIKEALDISDISTAAEAWYELSEDDQRLLWVAPTKGGCFTTAQRTMMKDPAFREAYHGKDDGDSSPAS